MEKKKALKLFRKLHKWPGVIIAFLAILFALSGIVLNHRTIFSGVNVNRNLMPPGYQYENWNLAAVRGGLPLDGNHFLYYGNIGVWEKTNNSIRDFNQGFPHGIDKRKIYAMALFHHQTLFAATHFGLYKRSLRKDHWTNVPLPLINQRLTDLIVKEDTLVVLSRNYLVKSVDGNEFNTYQLPTPVNYVHKTGLFNTLWELHSGELFGLAGKLFVDLIGLVVILLSVTGLLHFFFPKIAKRRKKKQKSNTKLSATRKLNLRWHNVVGYAAIVFLLINTTAGMFLRPPLLIPIAYTKVGMIPGTHLDNTNPWFDKLRRVSWNADQNRYLISTSDGFYWADPSLNKPLTKLKYQPPVSVMGCNVLEQTSPTKYLIGSFSGLFAWDTKSGMVLNAYTDKPPVEKAGPPISDHMITGDFNYKGQKYVFDYNTGMQSPRGIQTWEMPQKLLQKSPISLWSVALEVHTGRIFEFLVGPFYILYVPLAGLCLIMVLVSGFLLWWKAYRKTKKTPFKYGSAQQKELKAKHAI